MPHADSLKKHLLHRLLQQAHTLPFAVTYWDGETLFYNAVPGEEPRFTLHLRSAHVFDRMREDREVGFGEAYMDGEIEVEGDLAEVAAAALHFQKDLTDRIPKPIAPLQSWVRRALLHKEARAKAKQKEDVAHHYDLSNEFFRLWLDEQMVYSCAYFRTATDDLETAQRQKIDHVLRKVRLKPDETLLDIGSGWGAIVRRAAGEYDARALGITLSEEQLADSCASITKHGLEDKADVRLAHYQTLAREGVTFDKIVSIGMIEHVGKPHLGEFAESVRSLLRPGGLALLHCVTSPRDEPFNAWTGKHIFPGAYLPTVPELTAHYAANDLRIVDIENIGPHYALTLDCWSERFERALPQIREMFGERFVRMWRLYLRSSSACFREGGLEVHQILVSHGNPTDLPLTRDDVYSGTIGSSAFRS